MSDTFYQIAIDGPSGAGKSTLAKSLAARLGIGYLDTGAMYRAVGVAAMDRGIPTKDEAGLARLMDEIRLDVTFDDGVQRICVNGHDVTGRIRTQEAAMAASDVSSLAVVRQRLVAMQRALAAGASFVLDGRDIGTVVLPGAKYKFFVTASPRERAERRMAELAQRGAQLSYEQVLSDIIRRDEQDSSRAVDPLRRAGDAIVIDTTGLQPEQTLSAVMAVIMGE